MNQENSESIINFHSDFNRFVDETCHILEGLQLPCSPLQYVLRQELVNQDGLWLEFGVGSGHDTVGEFIKLLIFRCIDDVKTKI